MSRRSRHDSSEDDLDRIAGAAAVFIVLGVMGLIAKYGQQILTYGTIAIVVMVAVLVGLWLWKRNNKSAALNFDDEKILYMLRGMSPKFTLAAEKTGEQNPRIELIDANRLVEYYKMAFGKKIPIPEPPPLPVPVEQGPRTCPRCGGTLALKTAHKGEYAGHQFWGCTNYPKCTYLENIQEKVATH
jgi:topoisomerase-like DNA binding C4 zinc finger protein